MIWDYATQAATIAAPTGANKKGVQQYGTAVACPIRWEAKSSLFIDESGNQQQADGRAFFPPTVTPQIGSKVLINSTYYKIALLNTRTDLDGNTFYSATLQEMKGAG